MEVIRELFIKLGLDWESSGFASAQAAVDLLEKGLELLVRGAMKVAHAFVEMVTGASEYGSKIDDAAKKTGVARGALQEIGFVAEQSGSSFESATEAIGRLQHTVQMARDGNKEATETFKKLGVSLNDTNGKAKKIEDVFFDVGAALDGMSDDTKRSALSVDAFGKSGRELLPMFREGEAELEKMRDRVHALGAVMSDEAVVANEAFGDSLGEVRTFFVGIKNEIGTILIEKIQPLVTAFLDWAIANRQLISTKIDLYLKRLFNVVETVASVVGTLADALVYLVSNWKAWVVIAGSIALAFQLVNVGLLQTLTNIVLNTAAAIAYGVTMAATAAKSAVAWLIASGPILILGVLIAGVILLIEDMWVAWHGGKSVINTYGTMFEKWLRDIFTIKPGDDVFTAALKDMFGWIFKLDTVLDSLIRNFNRLGPIARAALGFALPGIEGALGDSRMTPGTITGSQSSHELPGMFTPRSGGSSPEAMFTRGPVGPQQMVSAPQITASIQVVASPNQSVEQVASTTTDRMSEMLDTKLRQTQVATGGSSRGGI